MNVSLVTIPLGLLGGLVLWRLAWPRAATEKGRTRVAGVSLFLALLLLFSALLSFRQAHQAEGWIEAREVRQAAVLRTVPEDQMVLLVGHVSDQNPVISRDAVALIDCESSCEERLPDEFKVELGDGQALVDDDGYDRIGWRTEIYGGHTTSFLRRQDQIVVVGDAAGLKPELSDADVFFSGTIDAFREHATTTHRLAWIALVLDMILAILLTGGGVFAHVKRKPTAAPESKPETPLAPPAA